MPFEAAKAVSATFCWNIRHALTPLFGADFPAICIPPHGPQFGKMIIDNAVVQRATEAANYYRSLEIQARGSSGGPSTLRAAPRGPRRPPNSAYARRSSLQTPSQLSSHVDQSPYHLNPGQGLHEDGATDSHYLSSPNAQHSSNPFTAVNRRTPDTARASTRSRNNLPSTSDILTSLSSSSSKAPFRLPVKRRLARRVDESDKEIVSPATKADTPRKRGRHAAEDDDDTEETDEDDADEDDDDTDINEDRDLPSDSDISMSSSSSSSSQGSSKPNNSKLLSPFSATADDDTSTIGGRRHRKKQKQKQKAQRASSPPGKKTTKSSSAAGRGRSMRKGMFSREFNAAEALLNMHSQDIVPVLPVGTGVGHGYGVSDMPSFFEGGEDGGKGRGRGRRASF